MHSRELIAGPYTLPAAKTGDKVYCHARDKDVVCGGLVECPIGPWPRVRKTGRPALILCGDLVRAVQTESELAVAHWWGVSPTTVWAWRKALGVGRVTEGTSALVTENPGDWRETEECREVLRRNAQDEDNRRQQSEDRAGKPAHPNTKKALLRAAKRKWAEERKRQRSLELRQGIAAGERQPPPQERPWTPREDAMLGQTLDRHIAEMLGRTVAAVRSRRQQLGVPMSRHSRLRQEPKPNED